MIKPFLKYHIKDRLVLWQQTRQLQKSLAQPVLVFTMAKVGSSSVYQSIKKQSKVPCFHIHSLSTHEVEEAVAICKENSIYPGSRSPVFALSRHVLEQQKMYKTISLFRDPIARNLSAFFDAFELYMGIKAINFKGTLQDIETVFYKKLDHSYCKDWFDVQCKQGIGIDVYEHVFPKETGHTIITGNTTKLLLLKSTLDDDLKASLIGNFCGIDSFKLINTNVTDTKKEASLYAEFKAYIKFPKAYLESQLESKYARHFFSEEEIASLYSKWGNGSI